MALPPHMRADDPANADQARRRLLRKSVFPRFPSLPSRSPKPPKLSLPPDTDIDPDIDTDTTDDIRIDDANAPHLPPDKDLYCWAVLYENQRGITLFSTPFYSPLSLLPTDPQPFTIPSSSTSRAHQPNVSLNDYPLPDGTWRWVSTAWMIDMRSDLGEVQHDGFEYNWRFGDKNWHPNVGKFGAAAWVRRRRWLRLMMRPALPLNPNPPTPLPDLVHHPWDGSDLDWQYVHPLLLRLGRDGRRLELWKFWLDPHACSHNSLEKRLSAFIPEGNAPSLVHLSTILANHGEAVLRSFVFPDSRAQFVHLVRQAGLVQQLENCLGHPCSVADVDFWSYNLDGN